MLLYFCVYFFFVLILSLFVVLLVGQEPDIPDLIDFMQSGDELKIINAAGYLQHLCYSKESVKEKVRYSVPREGLPYMRNGMLVGKFELN